MPSTHIPASSQSPIIGNPSKITFAWLLNLRWVALACQIVLVSFIHFFLNIKLPTMIILSIFLFIIVSNLLFFYIIRRQSMIPQVLFSLVMFIDVILLTALLHHTGGLLTPFTFLYLVHISLGAILMRTPCQWGLTAFSIICAAAFFFPENTDLFLKLHNAVLSVPQLITESQQIADIALSQSSSLHPHGMWFAFSITACFIVFFVGKTRKELEQHQEKLANLQHEKNKNEKLASLATLAAGAAHEFSTPLSVIAVAAGEMLYTLEKDDGDPELIEDLNLIQGQIERCRSILTQMASDAGEPLGESREKVTPGKLLADAIAELPLSPEQIDIVDETQPDEVCLPLRTVTRIIKGLIKNGMDAADEEPQIRIRCRKDERFLYFEIFDNGHGMAEEDLIRATDPFFTTKSPGKGLGLGLFLAKTVAERFGGALTIKSEQGKGTNATLSFALANIAIPTDK
ncbi:MAG: ATP-binding protein [Desulfobulbaceae bacterium]|nr:ATP-binding protein [Desulfobulbaceae bacterium]